MVGSLLGLTALTEDLSEAHVSVGQVRKLVEEAAAQLLGLVELACVNEADSVIGHLVKPLALVIDDRSPADTRSGRGITTLLLTRGGGVSFIRV